MTDLETLSALARARIANFLGHKASPEGGFAAIDLIKVRAAAAGMLGDARFDERHKLREAAYGNEPCDLFITPNEVCAAHGTGILTMRLVEQSDSAVLIRSDTHYQGRSDAKFKDEFVLARGEGFEQRAIVDKVESWLRPYKPRLIVCIPYFPEDLQVALAAKAICDAPLIIYVMDDNTLYSPGISRDLMAKALATANLRLAISSEMRNEYENQFRHKFWVLPPLVSENRLRTEPSPPPAMLGKVKEAVVIGNIWNEGWLKMLAAAIRDSSWKLHWYGGGDKPGWININLENLANDGIIWHDNTPQARIDAAVASAPFVVVPYGLMTETGHELALCKMSLPSRMPFVAATAGTPMLVLGHPATGAAKFVKRFDLGEVAPYDGKAFDKAAKKLMDRARQTEIRAKAAAIAPVFSSHGILDMLRGSAATGIIADMEFETMFAPQPGEYAVWVEAPYPPAAITGFQETYAALRRLKAKNYKPDFVMDIGASTGIWSWVMSDVFPQARFVLADPVHSRYPQKNMKPGFTLVEAAVSDKPGKMTFSVSDDLYNSSLIAIGSVATKVDVIEARVVTVDQIFAEQKVKGRGILKVDVQFAEHLVLRGAEKALAEQVDFVLLELTMTRVHPDALTIVEMIELMDKAGFRYFDDIGDWRAPGDGELEQKDVMFARKDMFEQAKASGAEKQLTAAK